MNIRIRDAHRWVAMPALALAFVLRAVGAHAATFQVNTTLDAPASPAAISAGVCDDGQGECTLRAAIQVADASPTASTIQVPAGRYVLTLTGVDEAPVLADGTYTVAHTPDASKGDLNITQSMAIIGAGSGRTVIGWAVTADQDRVFHIEVPASAQSNITVTIQGVTVEHGYVPAPVVLDASVPTAVVRFARMGGGIAIGAGAEIQVIDSTATEGEGDEGGCGGGGGHGGGGCAGPEGHGGPGESESGATIQMVTLSDVQVVNNVAGGEGGGIYNTGPITLDHVTVTGNTSAANGGGIYNDAVMLMTDSQIGTLAAPNQASNGGGLFETGFHTSQIERSAFVGNIAASGGGIAGRRMVLEEISRSTIADNTASGGGGGIMTNGRVELVNDTVADNTVTGKVGKAGAGLSGFGPASAMPSGGGANAANFSLVNTIVANNTYAGSPATLLNCGGKGEGDPAARFYSMGHNIEDGNSCGLTAGGDEPGVNPQLEPLANNGGPTLTMALQPGSPAIDAGDDAQCPNDDQRGQIGRADGNVDGVFQCDVGAYELFVHSADLHIDSVTAPDQVFVGNPFQATATVHVDPAATTSATGVQVVTSALPPSVSVEAASVTTPAGTSNCQQTGVVVSCAAGTLAPDQTATVTLTLRANEPNPEAAIMFTASQATPADPNPNNNSAQIRTAELGQANLSVTAGSTSLGVKSGATAYLPFIIRNAGPVNAERVRFAVSLPGNVQFASMDMPGASCNFDGTDVPPSVVCTVDSLAAGQALNGVVTVTASTIGDGAASFAVDSPEEDVNLADNATQTLVSVKSAASTTAAPESSGGGGCVSAPGSGFDPLLLGLVAFAALALAWQRRRHRPVQH